MTIHCGNAGFLQNWFYKLPKVKNRLRRPHISCLLGVSYMWQIYVLHRTSSLFLFLHGLVLESFVFDCLQVLPVISRWLQERLQRAHERAKRALRGSKKAPKALPEDHGQAVSGKTVQQPPWATTTITITIFYTYRYLCSVYMNKYTCIYQYVSSRAGGAKGQPLHVCSLTWGGRLHTQRSWTHIYVYINHIYIHLHTHIFSMHKTHPSSCAPE